MSAWDEDISELVAKTKADFPLMRQRLNTEQSRLEVLIATEPTGAKREQLTQANIYLMLALQELDGITL